MTPPMHSLCPCLLSACLSAHHKRAHTQSRRVAFIQRQARPAKLALLISLRLPDPPIELLGSTLYSQTPTRRTVQAMEPLFLCVVCSPALLLSARIESTALLSRPPRDHYPNNQLPTTHWFICRVSQVNYPRVCVQTSWSIIPSCMCEVVSRISYQIL